MPVSRLKHSLNRICRDEVRNDFKLHLRKYLTFVMRESPFISAPIAFLFFAFPFAVHALL